VEDLGVRGSNADEAREVHEEFAGVVPAPGGGDQVVEVGERVPGHESHAGRPLQEGDEPDGGLDVGLAGQRHVQEDVGVQEDHRYFSARARKRSSSREAGSNLPCHRYTKEAPSSAAISRRASSMREERGTPRERANRLARGSTSASMVMVSLVFMVDTYTCSSMWYTYLA
jgi:hypothetical protein